MRILLDECINLDECIDAEVSKAFPRHVVKTVAQIGWSGTDDGPLLVLAQEQFDVFVAIDRNLEHQQNLKKFNLGFVMVHVRSNEIASYLHLFAQIEKAAEDVRAGQIIHVVAHEIQG